MMVMPVCFATTIKDIKKLQHNKLSHNVMASGWQKEKTFFMQIINERKKGSMERKKNAYLQAIACDNHCNGHDDDLVATKNHCNAHDDNPTTTKE